MSFPNVLIGNPSVNKWQLPQLIENLLNRVSCYGFLGRDDLNDSGLMARKNAYTKTLFRIKVNSRLDKHFKNEPTGDYSSFSKIGFSLVLHLLASP